MKPTNLTQSYLPLGIVGAIMLVGSFCGWADVLTEGSNGFTATTIAADNERADSIADVNRDAILDSLLSQPDVIKRIEINEEGDTVIHFSYLPLDFGETYKRESDADEIAGQSLVEDEASDVAADALPESSVAVRALDNSKSVGAIPFNEGITPSGGKTITVPIFTAAVSGSAPQVALTYNSQAGNSVAGYGWSVSGIPSINAVNRTVHYDGAAGPADIYNASTCAFALDGVRLVENNNSSVEGFHYETAQGFVFVKKVMSGTQISHFEALYPNGSKATFGFKSTKSTQYTYPLTSLVDIKGYRVDFDYIGGNNVYYISKIRYGSKSETHPAEIKFEYDSRTDFHEVYVSNTPVSVRKLLKKIVSSDNGQELRAYTLTHTLTSGANQLTQLDCASGSSSLNPLVFSYDYYRYQPSDATMKEEWRGLISAYFHNAEQHNMQFIRGKFSKNSFSDGIIIFPGKYSTYGVVATQNKHNRYGSNYPDNQQILVVPNIDDYSAVVSIFAELGFQTINAVDVNGDGIDEIVKVNFQNSYVDKTVLRISVYSIIGGVIGNYRQLYVTVPGTVTDGDFISPISRSYYFGNFRGNGKAQLLTVSHSKTPLNQARTSDFSLIDLETGNVSSASSLFQHSPTEGDYVHAFDADGDNKTELCHADQSGYMVFGLSGNDFKLLYNATNLARLKFTGGRCKFVDLNGDGKLDILVPPMNSYEEVQYISVPVWAPEHCPVCLGKDPIVDKYNHSCRHCEEDLLRYYEENRYEAKCRNCDMQLQLSNNNQWDPHSAPTFTCSNHGTELDLTLSNYVDFGNLWGCYTGTGKGFVYSSQNIVKTEAADKFTLMDINRDGLTDLIRVKGGRANLFLNAKGVISGSATGQSITVPAGASSFIPANVVNPYNSSAIICIKDAEIYTVSFTKEADKAHLLTCTTDSYGNTHSNSYTEMARGSNYLPTTTAHSYPYASVPFNVNLLASTQTYPADNSLQLSGNSYFYYGATANMEGLGFVGFEKVQTIDNVWHTVTTHKRNPQMFGVTTSEVSPTKEISYTYARNEESNKKANPRVTSVSEINKLTGDTTKTTYRYDSFNNPIAVRTTEGNALETVTSTTYYTLLSTDRVIAGQPLTTTVERTRGSDSWTDREEITYDLTSRLPVNKKTFTGTDGTFKTGEIQWTYDDNGNVTLEKSAPYNVTEFSETSYAYDSAGRFVTSKTNPLGQTTLYSNFDKYGNPQTITDFKNRATTCTYNDWGEQTSVTTPSGVVSASVSEWGGKGVFTVTATQTGSPTTVAHYDGAWRQLRKGTQRFDGKWQYTDQVFNNLGLPEKVSMPFTGSAPTHWTTYKYDPYGRITKQDDASGKTTTWSYNGKNATETRNGIATTRTCDASGAVVSVTDLGGTINYTLRPDGQAASITAPGGVVTTFGYDSYGRRTSIADPSAGTQTFSDSYTAEGVRTVTATDANAQTLTTVYDRYGRVTSVERPEFNTSYTYNTDGVLSKETSTNGTAKLYVYDTYGRISGVREDLSNDKFLIKTLTYTSGNPSMVRYISHKGILGSEFYTYANGHNTEIHFSSNLSPTGKKSVWKLTEENAFGQPTEAVTGPLTRTYTYTEFGLPTGRKAGSVQNVGYEWNVNTGTLTSRTDLTHTLTETFSYDSLNRLSAIDSAQITYADNGNILSMPGVGTLTYGNAERPYQVSAFTPAAESIVPMRTQQIAYTSFQRPASVEENGLTAAWTYNAQGNRVKMQLNRDANHVKTTYYFGAQYEIDYPTEEERLYIGGDAYSAPAIYVKHLSGAGELHYICRDHLGSITHVTNATGNLEQELSYDPWGRLRNPATHALYSPDSAPTPMFGRGFTGHEHLPKFGLVNMNARLYDSALGRFLSPDPYVQTPDFTQNFNRYTYCLNNPLSYIDQDGEWYHLVIGAAVGAIINIATNWNNINNFWDGVSYGAIGAVSGAIAAGIGGGISSALPVAGSASGGFAAGFLGTNAATVATPCFYSSALIGAGISYSQTSISVFGNNLLEGQNAWTSFKQSQVDGALAGVIGGISGGIIGGISASYYGRDFLDGSVAQTEVIADAHLPSVIQNNEMNCGPASAESITGVSQDDYRTYLMDKYHYGQESAIDMKHLTAAIESLSDRNVSYINSKLPTDALQANQYANWINKNARFILSSKTGHSIGHLNVLNRISIKHIYKISGAIINKVIYEVMDPASGVFKNISAHSMNHIWLVTPK